MRTLRRRPGRDAFIHTFVNAYNRTRLRCLNYSAPIQALANQTEDNTEAGAHPEVSPVHQRPRHHLRLGTGLRR